MTPSTGVILQNNIIGNTDSIDHAKWKPPKILSDRIIARMKNKEYLIT